MPTTSLMRGAGGKTFARKTTVKAGVRSGNPSEKSAKRTKERSRKRGSRNKISAQTPKNRPYNSASTAAVNGRRITKGPSGLKKEFPYTASRSFPFEITKKMVKTSST